ncbi:uncharacterized protein IL334_006191 [Kwoniella shivajii]|uniref:ABM domain-containing protein n=1 Tax=Kwoniella shivajii TaxID=564305 RepID=A0ABZ1D978_9TREE|nr:hypothetical protein IL334_006191 [Kwoniella shivajii]
MVYMVIVFVEAKVESIEAVKSRMTEAGKIYEKDPGTIEFSLQQDVSNPQKFILVERYDKQSSHADHKQNPIFEETMKWLKENVTKPNEPHHINL